jgi:dsDNA-binding SOS-regulon protein
MKYERKAGTFSEADTYMKIIDLIDQLQDQLSILGHYKKENNDELIGQGFLAIQEMMKMTRIQITNLATGKMRRKAGYR